MFIRPYFISALAYIILTGVLFLGLRKASKSMPTRERQSTIWLVRALGFAFLLFTLVTTVAYSTHPLLKLGQYLQTMIATLIFFSLTRFFYAAYEQFNSKLREEATSYTRTVLVAIIWEILYLSWRYWIGYRDGSVPARPLYLETPIVLILTWSMVVLLRTWIAAERRNLNVQTGWKENIYYFIRPKNKTTFFLRSMLVVIFFAEISVISVALAPLEEYPLWLPILSDTLLLIGLVYLVFNSLQLQYPTITLEVRILGASLTLFLLFTYFLSWLQTAVFLGQSLPGVPIVNVIGVSSNYNFVAPQQYQAVIDQLKELLLPIVGLELLGGAVFTLALGLFYRKTILYSLDEILYGISQIEQGNFDYKIPRSSQDEFNRIGMSINKLAIALRMAQANLLIHQKNLEMTIEKRTNELRLENDRRKLLEIKQAILDERKRIGEEAHDGLLQSLMGIGIRLRRAPKLSRKNPKEIEEELLDLEKENQKTVKELRQLINNLNLDIAQNGMLSGIRSVIRSLEQSYPITIDANINYPFQLLDIHQELDVLRIVQEALNNACKHSQGKQILISIQPDPNTDVLLIKIEDDGVGYDPTLDNFSENHWGIINIKNRTDRLNAILEISTAPEMGTKLLVNIPLNTNNS